MTDYDPRKDAAESYDAALKAIRMEKIRAGEIVPHKGEPTNTCQRCGADYWVKPYRRAKSKYCSAECRAASQTAEHLNIGPKPWASANLDGHRHRSRSRFSIGHEPWNKGLKGIHLSPETEFQSGCNGGKKMPIGSVTVRDDKNGRPRAWIKTTDGWVPRAQAVYTAKYGAIPDGHVVHHVDHDTLNDSPSNLVAVTPSDHARIHHAA